jgi:predicted MFS family arabinose efflux permease
MKSFVWICLFLGAFAIGTDTFMLAGLLPRVARDLASTPAIAAQLATVFSVSYAVGAPLLATLLGRADRRTLLVIGLAGVSAADVVAALAPGLPILFLARVAAALAACVYTPTAAVVAAGLVSPQRRGRALALVTSGITLSLVTGVQLAAQASDRVGWRATFAGVAILLALLAAVSRVALPGVAPAQHASLIGARLASIRKPGVSRVLATTVLGVLAGYLGYIYVAPIASTVGAAGTASLAWILAGFGVGATAGALGLGLAVDRYGQQLVLRAGLLMQALALLSLAGLGLTGVRAAIVPIALAFALLGAGSLNYGTPQQHRLLQLVPDSGTALVSLNTSAIYIGIGLAGALGALALQLGPVANCLTGAGIALVTMLVVGPASLLRPRARLQRAYPTGGSVL